MMARRAFGRGALALLLGSTIFLIGCDDDSFSRYWTYNYRLMVEVETPEGVKKGHNVISVTRAVSGTLLPGPMRGGGQKAKGITPCISPRKGRILPARFDKSLYRQRHKVENMFGKLKEVRAQIIMGIIE